LAFSSIGEITEIQRLSEELFRQEWVTFKADDQKRWTNYTLAQEEQLRETSRQFDKYNERMVAIDGMPPNLIAPPSGCAFAARCNCAQDGCCLPPELISYAEDRLVSCWCAGQQQP
jgi:oligopeptide/dipeptide ABC transporter ATP-binding protein